MVLIEPTSEEIGMGTCLSKNCSRNDQICNYSLTYRLFVL